jgi:hypothetical protein
MGYHVVHYEIQRKTNLGNVYYSLNYKNKICFNAFCFIQL